MPTPGKFYETQDLCTRLTDPSCFNCMINHVDWDAEAVVKKHWPRGHYLQWRLLDFGPCLEGRRAIEV